MPDRQAQQAYLRLDVEPTSTRIFIDSQYRGIVKGWRGQIVPVEPGHRMVELRASGFITRRFDVEVGPGEQVTLQVRMEPSLEREAQELE